MRLHRTGHFHHYQGLAGADAGNVRLPARGPGFIHQAPEYLGFLVEHAARIVITQHDAVKGYP